MGGGTRYSYRTQTCLLLNLSVSVTYPSPIIRRFAMSWRDDWPSTPDGKPYDGMNLLQLTLAGKSPFGEVWDVRLLIREIEENLNTRVADIPFVDKGSNNYVRVSLDCTPLNANYIFADLLVKGFHLQTSDKRDLVARLARGDVNMPGFDGFSIDVQAPEARFETAIYSLLQSESLIRSSRLLYSRVPVQHPDPKLTIPQDLRGRRLFVFEKSEGVTNVWTDLSPGCKV